MSQNAKPMLFSGPMIRALLDGGKTQTRRVAKVTDKGCKPGFITPISGFVPRRYTAENLKSGLQVFSPIVHNHLLTIEYHLPEDSAFWRDHNFAMLAKASELVVLCLPGHNDSAGVNDEIRFAKQCGIPVKFERNRHWTDIDTRGAA